MNRRILILALVFLGLLAALGGRFAYLMLGEGRQVLSQSFVNTPLVSVVESLLSKGVIQVHGKVVAVDEDRLKKAFPRPQTQSQVKRLLPFVRQREDGRLALDARAVSVRYQPLPGGAERGPIWDREGEVLAVSVKEPRTRKSRREYPLGPAAFHVVGASHPAFGDRGIEAAYRDELARGLGVTLTISGRLQRAAAQALGDRAGAAVVMAVPSGEILALATTPSFDPGEPRAQAWISAERDQEGKPFVNRALGALYPPGSVFKVIDSAAWLEGAGRDLNLKVECKGESPAYRIRDQHGHGPMTLEPAFARSCNIFFAEVGVRLGASLKRYAERFGFNAPISVLPEDRRGVIGVPSLAFAWQSPNEGGLQSYRAVDFRRNPKVVAQSAIGQNLVVATPLQMALVAATVASDGRRPQPIIVRAVGDRPDRDEHAAGAGTAVLRPETAQAITRMMVRVMTEGTGRGLPRIYRDRGAVRSGRPMPGDAKAITVAGKTGTAEVGAKPRDRRPHAWFIGFAPAERPEVAVAVVIEHGGAGAETAGPLAVALLADALDILWSPAATKMAEGPWAPSGDSKS